MELEPDDSMARFQSFFFDLSDKEWGEASQTLKQYLLAAGKIARAITNDPTRNARFEEDITQPKDDKERD